MAVDANTWKPGSVKNNTVRARANVRLPVMPLSQTKNKPAEVAIAAAFTSLRMLKKARLGKNGTTFMSTPYRISAETGRPHLRMPQYMSSSKKIT